MTIFIRSWHSPWFRKGFAGPDFADSPILWSRNAPTLNAVSNAMMDGEADVLARRLFFFFLWPLDGHEILANMIVT